MSGKFQTIDRDTAYLLPPSLQDWLPEKHLARFVVDIVDRLDLRELDLYYGGGGKPPYHPALLLAVLFYGYATGVFSSRKLEQSTYDSVAFRFITADTHPDHATLATFRKRFLKELEGLFVQLLVMAKVMGLLQLGHVSLDGTKIKPNASKHKALSWGYANQLEEQLRREVQELLRRAEQAVAEEALEIDIPDELTRGKTDWQPLRRPRRRSSGGHESVSRRSRSSMRRSTGGARRRQCRAGRRPVGARPNHPSRDHLSQQPNDKQEIAPALERLNAVEGRLGKPQGVLADAGYFSADNVQRCEADEIMPYLCDRRERHHLPLEERFQSPPPCPVDADAVTAMVHRLRTPAGKQLYAKRKSTVETVFGIIKEVLGFRRFHLRGLMAAQGEWNLVCMAGT